MTKADFYLLEDIANIKENGVEDRNPRPRYEDGRLAHTKFVTHNMRSYDLSKEFPICSLRPIAWKSAIKEVLWIYQDASNDLDMLNDKYGIHWWNSWESKDIPNTIGQRYGATVKKYNLMENLLLGIKRDPYGRRHIMNLWQESDFAESDGLHPCAYETIWSVRGSHLDMILVQRSGDMLVASGAGGVNEVQYAALLMMVARHCGYNPGKFTHIVVNEQIYDRHNEQADILLSRLNEGLNRDGNVKLILNPDKSDFYSFTIDDFTLDGYEPIKPQLKFELAI